MKRRAFQSLMAMAVMTAAAGWADPPRELSDLELEQVTAGTSTVPQEEGLVTFEVSRRTRSGTTIQADGSMTVVEAVDRLNIGTLILTRGAQSGLSSLIKVNAVNSEVNVLLNLNISIDSNIGTLNQLNLNGRVALPRPGG